jgi:hypothetical protein
MMKIIFISADALKPPKVNSTDAPEFLSDPLNQIQKKEAY